MSKALYALNRLVPSVKNPALLGQDAPDQLVLSVTEEHSSNKEPASDKDCANNKEPVSDEECVSEGELASKEELARGNLILSEQDIVETCNETSNIFNLHQRTGS